MATLRRRRCQAQGRGTFSEEGELLGQQPSGHPLSGEDSLASGPGLSIHIAPRMMLIMALATRRFNTCVLALEALKDHNLSISESLDSSTKQVLIKSWLNKSLNKLISMTFQVGGVE